MSLKEGNKYLSKSLRMGMIKIKQLEMTTLGVMLNLFQHPLWEIAGHARNDGKREMSSVACEAIQNVLYVIYFSCLSLKSWYFYTLFLLQLSWKRTVFFSKNKEIGVKF